MSKSNLKSDASIGGHESLSRRVADELHGHIDKAAEKGEKFEDTLQERSSQLQDKAYDLNSEFTSFARKNPWAVVGGSVVLGILISTMVRRR